LDTASKEVFPRCHRVVFAVYLAEGKLARWILWAEEAALEVDVVDTRLPAEDFVSV